MRISTYEKENICGGSRFNACFLAIYMSWSTSEDVALVVSITLTHKGSGCFILQEDNFMIFMALGNIQRNEEWYAV